ncbi:beta-lactamase/transpeptidase-like protein [Xylariaceae sp. FL0594]|nr:beta-lactamase/transpeptidase-like protein [Xylariaceae sp. FL0594]
MGEPDVYFPSTLREQTSRLSLSALDNITFSLGLFSAHSDDVLQYHHTGPDVQKSTLGVNRVDGDSVYRLASMSKVITVYAGLLLLDPSDWHKPLTEIFPDISSLPANDPVHHVQWKTIIPFALASQMSGLPRDAVPFSVGELAYDYYFGPNPIDPTTLGLPPLTLDSEGVDVPCKSAACSGVEYIEGVQSPSFPAFQTPGYADTNFVLLGRVISQLTGLPLNEEWFQKAVFQPLNMTRTSSLSPTDKDKPYNGYVVAGDPAVFAYQGEISTSSGGVFSSTYDVAKLGRSILRSTLLLSPEQTRAWMKPTAFTAGLEFALGLGWEIYRYTDRSKTGVVTDMYTKLGDAGNYASFLVLVPDYDVGFSVLSASGLASAKQRSDAAHLLADLLSESLLPALRDQAGKETRTRYEGVYTAAASSSSSSSNATSKITLRFNDTPGPSYGLTLAGIVNNGVDMLAYYQDAVGKTGQQLVLAPSTYDEGKKQRAFVVTAVKPPGASYTGLFSKQWATNAEWINNNAVTYGGQAFGTIYVDEDEDGRAIAVSPAVLRGKKFVRG